MRTRRRHPHRGQRRRGGFQPPHCPNPNCPHHFSAEDWHFVRNGSFLRPSDGRRFPLFRCATCRRGFSSRTFSTTYWLRRRDLLRPIACWISEGPALRQLARVLKVSHTTVARQLARLGRHCLLFHLQLLASDPLFRLREPLVIDGFESFAYSQYFPFHLNLAAGATSCFLYAFNDSPLRRKGRMTSFQIHRRMELETRFGRPDPKAIERAIGALLRELLALLPPGERLDLHSDDHPAYQRAIQGLPREKDCPRIHHSITSSKERRTTSNPLFPVNLADLRIRHGQANHRRETIAFSKRRQAAIERMAVFLVWANCVKRKSEKGGQETSAMAVGLLARRLGWAQILKRRLFPRHGKLSPVWRNYYERIVKMPIFEGREAVHACAYAF